MDVPECVRERAGPRAPRRERLRRAPERIKPVTIFFCYPQPPTFSERDTELMRAREQLNST